MQSALTSVSLDQWMEKLTTWKTATRELVRLWLVNELGCQRDLANHLGLSDRAIRKHVAKLREDGDLPPLDASDGRGRNHPQKQELSSYSSPVPKTAYPSAVMPEEEKEEEPTLDLPTAEELMARVLNLEAENTALREQLKAAHSLELVSDEKRNDTVLAEHYVHTQEHGSCDSYKDAQYQLSCFMDLLSSKSGSHADRWEESEFHVLSQDLSAAAKMCANASGSYQERLDAELAEWKATAAPAPAPSADVAALTKKLERLQKRLKDRDRAIAKLTRRLQKTGGMHSDLLDLEPWEETDEERLRFYPTEAQTRAGLGNKPSKYRPDEFFPAEVVRDAIEQVRSMLYWSKGAYEVDDIYWTAKSLSYMSQNLQEEFFDRSNGTDGSTITPINHSEVCMHDVTVVDVDQLTIDV